MRLSRKEKFQVALNRAQMTQEQWRFFYYKVSRVHLSQFFNGTKGASPKLVAAIDRFIAEQSGGQAPDPSERFTQKARRSA